MTYLEKNSTKFILDELQGKKDSLEDHLKDLKSFISSEQSLEVIEEVSSEPLLPLKLERKYYRTREAAELLSIDPNTLRDWENSFSEIKPQISQTGHRVYSLKDIRVFHQIRYWVVEKKQSIEDAKKHIRRNPKVSPDQVQPLRQLLVQLKDLLHTAKLDPGEIA